MFAYTLLYKTIGAHDFVTEDIDEGGALVLVAGFLLFLDDVEFYLADALGLDEVGERFALNPCVAVLLKFHCFGEEVWVLLVKPYPFYSLLEETEVTAGT